MKTEIENLINLAKDFVEFALSVKQNDGFSEYGKTRVYFANNKSTKAVEFDTEIIEISFYNSKIELPLNFTQEYLKNVYETAKIELSELKAYNFEKIIQENENQKREAILACEKKLKQLKES